jgi:hypothetical protein
MSATLATKLHKEYFGYIQDFSFFRSKKGIICWSAIKRLEKVGLPDTTDNNTHNLLLYQRELQLANQPLTMVIVSNGRIQTVPSVFLHGANTCSVERICSDCIAYHGKETLFVMLSHLQVHTFSHKKKNHGFHLCLLRSNRRRVKLLCRGSSLWAYDVHGVFPLARIHYTVFGLPA